MICKTCDSPMVTIAAAKGTVCVECLWDVHDHRTQERNKWRDEARTLLIQRDRALAKASSVDCLRREIDRLRKKLAAAEKVMQDDANAGPDTVAYWRNQVASLRNDVERLEAERNALLALAFEGPESAQTLQERAESAYKAQRDKAERYRNLLDTLTADIEKLHRVSAYIVDHDMGW